MPLPKSPPTSIASSAVEGAIGQEAVSGVSENKVDPIEFWTRRGSWPKEYFRQDDQTRKDFREDFEKDSWFKKYWEPESNMTHLLARKRSVRSKNSESISTTASDQKSREGKSAPYKQTTKRVAQSHTEELMHSSPIEPVWDDVSPSGGCPLCDFSIAIIQQRYGAHSPQNRPQCAGAFGLDLLRSNSNRLRCSGAWKVGRVSIHILESATCMESCMARA
jgi:hypothetical protein